MCLSRPLGAARTRAASWRRRWRDDRGSTAVEFAIGAPVIVGLLLLLVQAFFFGMGSLAAMKAGAAARYGPLGWLAATSTRRGAASARGARGSARSSSVWRRRTPTRRLR